MDPAALWRRLRTNPRYAPEMLALLAVERLGTEADRYTRWLRDTYPHATPEALATLARERFARHARYSVILGTLTSPAGEVAALAWNQARLVLHVAAAYGREAASPERAAELLALLRVHPSVEVAKAALSAAVRAEEDEDSAPDALLLRLAQALAGPAVGRAIRWLPGRLVPGAGAIVDVLFNGGAMERLARRATEFYRPKASSDA